MYKTNNQLKRRLLGLFVQYFMKIFGFSICWLVHLRNLRICSSGMGPRICGFVICRLFKKVCLPTSACRTANHLHFHHHRTLYHSTEPACPRQFSSLSASLRIGVRRAAGQHRKNSPLFVLWLCRKRHCQKMVGGGPGGACLHSLFLELDGASSPAFFRKGGPQLQEKRRACFLMK